MSHLACPVRFTLPRRVYVENADLRRLVESACAQWNDLRPGLFLVVNEPAAPVWVRKGSRTWVKMPIDDAQSIVHWAGEVDPRWMAHELGHTLGLGDHVWPGLDTTGYHAPMVDDPEDETRYRGVMSYLDSMTAWFGEDDRRMVNHHFANAGKAILPMCANS